jgi:RyR domain-containing protein
VTSSIPPGQRAQLAKIARVCHEAFRAWCASLGDTTKPPWEQAEEWRRDFAVNGVRQVLNGASPSDIHDLWRSRRQAAGWTHGDQKAPRLRKTPNLVPYDQLRNPDEMKKAALFTSTALTLGCGVERWAVKTLTDPDAPRVDLSPVDSSVHELVALAAPPSPTTRVAPAEFTTYRVTADLTYVKLEEKDSDVHMVIKDPQTGQSMIIEAACPACAEGSAVTDQIAQVRQIVEARFPRAIAGLPENLQPPLSVTVTGVAFFDYPHGQTGYADNGIELHPVLSFTASE